MATRRKPSAPAAAPLKRGRKPHDPAEARALPTKRGRKPHDPLKVAKVRKMLGQGGKSQRQIAAACQVSRATVRQIQDGSYLVKRPSTGRLLEGETLLAEAVRCETCGHKVTILPCRICKAQPMAPVAPPRSAARPFYPGRPHNLANQLSAEHQRRFEKIQVQRNPARKFYP